MTNIIISNVKKDKKYKGAYARIFRILEKNSLGFSEIYETDNSAGFINGTYFLEINVNLDWNEEKAISKIKNVKIV